MKTLLWSIDIYYSKKNYTETKFVRKAESRQHLLQQEVEVNERIKVKKRAHSWNSRSKQIPFKLFLGNYNTEVDVHSPPCILKCQASELIFYSTYILRRYVI
jgi:hypothetical protein